MYVNLFHPQKHDCWVSRETSREPATAASGARGAVPGVPVFPSAAATHVSPPRHLAVAYHRVRDGASDAAHGT